MIVFVAMIAALAACARALAGGHEAHGVASRDQVQARAAIVARFRGHSPAAVSVAWCESRLHPTAIGGNNVGLFQINFDAHHLIGERWDAFVRRFVDRDRNIAFAFRLSRGGRDWSAWSCQP